MTSMSNRNITTLSCFFDDLQKRSEILDKNFINCCYPLSIMPQLYLLNSSFIFYPPIPDPVGCKIRPPGCLLDLQLKPVKTWHIFGTFYIIVL